MTNGNCYKLLQFTSVRKSERTRGRGEEGRDGCYQ